MYIIHPQAAHEHTAQVAYYEAQQKGLGRRYHADFQAALDLVCVTPQSYKVVRVPDTRRLLFRVFPFELIYRIGKDGIEVLAIAHQRRQPQYWLGRI